MYYKQIEENILIAIGKSKAISGGLTEITGEEYNAILSVIASKPEDTETTIYKLHADTLEYVAYDRPEEPTPTEPSNPYGIDDTTYNSIIDDYTSSITSEVASNGY